MNADFRRMENPSVVYALSMSWFKTWETFVCRDGGNYLLTIAISNILLR